MKYTIISINNRAEKNINDIKNKLSSFDYVNKIKFIDGNKTDTKEFFENNEIDYSVWKPYDGRTTPALPGEYGVWASYINIFNYIVENKIDKLLVLEDDAILSDNFVDRLNLCLVDLPDSFDFLSLSYFDDQNDLKENSNISSKYIHKSINQYSSSVGIIFSLKGAKKILKLVNRIGLEYTSDCFIFYHSRNNLLNGYSLIKNKEKLIYHNNLFKSTIDPENYRLVENVI